MSKPSVLPSVLPSLVLCEFHETGLPDHESLSPFCMKVHRALRVAGLPYTSRRIGNPSELRELNPAMQAPVLLVDDVPIADSTRILARIAELAPGTIEVETDPVRRAEALLWEEMADVSLSGYLVAARWADDANWPRTRVAIFGPAPWFVRTLIAPKIRQKVVGSLVARDIWRKGPEACWATFGLLLDHLEARTPKRGFWMGEHLSVADLSIFSMVHSLRTPLTPWQAERVAERTNLSNYLDRVHAATRETRQAAEPRATKRGAAHEESRMPHALPS